MRSLQCNPRQRGRGKSMIEVHTTAELRSQICDQGTELAILVVVGRFSRGQQLGRIGSNRDGRLVLLLRTQQQHSEQLLHAASCKGENSPQPGRGFQDRRSQSHGRHRRPTAGGTIRENGCRKGCTRPRHSSRCQTFPSS